jgi:hypothetical protein
MAEDIQVYPLMQQWSFTESYQGVSGTRVYLEDKSQPGVGGTAETLPDIGDTWDDDDYDGVTLKSIETSYPSTEDCGRRFVCNYDSNPFTQVEVLNDEDTPTNVEISGELCAIEPYSDKVDSEGKHTEFYWTWDSDDEGVNQSIFTHAVLTNIKYTKTISDVDDYVMTCNEYTGHTNDAKFFGFPKGMVLFEGANLYQFKNKAGWTRWRAELNFSIRNVTDNLTDDDKNGWNRYFKHVSFK